MNRAQTLPDFAVGVGLFLLTTLFIALFVPQVVLPYDDQDNQVVADRLANDLAGDLLTNGSQAGEAGTQTTESTQSQGQSHQLDRNATSTAFEWNQNELLATVGIAQQYRVNVTIQEQPGAPGNGGILCVSDDAATTGPYPDWIDADCENSDERFAIGPALGPELGGDGGSPGDADRTVATATRTVSAGSTTVVVQVVIW